MNRDQHYSLLSDPLFSVRNQAHQRVMLTLPGVLSSLEEGSITAFEALQIHQRQAWHSFLIQLAALGVSRSKRASTPRNAEVWKGSLLTLTDGLEEAWTLVVNDLSKPAFMQPPIPEGSLEAAHYKLDVTTPDDLDILVTSSNHDVKSNRITAPFIEHWLYAVIVEQTMEGFLGRGNYGIVRMNGGFGNRPQIGMTPSLDWSTCFQRDLAMLLSARKQIIDKYDYNNEGVALLWLLPWDGKKASAIALNKCDPFFIEVCRRLRFQEQDGGLRCWRANTMGPRIGVSDDLKGITGDPWTPIDKVEGKALTIDRAGFTYKKLKDILLSGDYERPAALSNVDMEEGGLLTATALVRGQGKTGGFHHRVIPVPSKAIRVFGSLSEREELENRAEEMVDLASRMQRKVLGPALRALLSAGTDIKVSFERVRPWIIHFDTNVDNIFFPELWNSLDTPYEGAKLRWQKSLFNLAKEQLHDAMQSCPLPSIRRYEALCAAESIFYGSAHKHLEELFSVEEKEVSNE